MMSAGTLLARYAAQDGHPLLAVVGLWNVVLGAGLLVWAGWRYDDLHGRVREGNDLTFPGMVRFIGLSTVAFTFTALALSSYLLV